MPDFAWVTLCITMIAFVAIAVVRTIDRDPSDQRGGIGDQITLNGRSFVIMSMQADYNSGDDQVLTVCLQDWASYCVQNRIRRIV